MSHRSFSLMLATLLCSSISCSTSPIVPDIEAPELNRATKNEAIRRVDGLVTDRRRLLDIQYALTVGSARRCGASSRPQAGVMLSQASDFEDDALRHAASRDYSLDNRVGVVYVVPGGSFDVAGVRAGDQLVEADGEVVKSANDFLKLMLETNERQFIDLVLVRGSERIEMKVPLELGCPVVFALMDRVYLTAYQDTQLRVVVPVGLVRYADGRDVLAVVLAHQLAHVLFDDDSKPWSVQESRADRFGLKLAAAAGFDVSDAVEYWEYVSREYPWLIDEAKEIPMKLRKGRNGYSHYGIGNRIAAIRETVAEIEAYKTGTSATR